MPTRDLLNVLDAAAKAGAGFRSLADAWADTTTPHGRLMLTVLGGLAEFERELIRARCRSRCSVFVERAKPSSSARSSAMRMITVASGCLACILES